jgi:3-oxoacyl-[acyl-carrier protein] reductase
MAGKSLSKSRVALVTGGAGGIGRAICEILSRRTYHVLIGYKSSENEAKKLSQKLKDAVALPIDVKDTMSIKSAVETINATIGRLDVLVNNAGTLIGSTGPIDHLSIDQWNEMLAIHVTGPAILSGAALPLLRKSNAGRIINIASVHGISGGRPGLAIYATAKAGLIGFTKAAAKELAPSITVNAVAPGFVEVGMTRTMDADLRARSEQLIPMGRFATAAEVGETVAFLASEEASYTTGQTFIVSGGRIDLDLGRFTP